MPLPLELVAAAPPVPLVSPVVVPLPDDVAVVAVVSPPPHAATVAPIATRTPTEAPTTVPNSREYFIARA
jgi:hypothetical protein